MCEDDKNHQRSISKALHGHFNLNFVAHGEGLLEFVRAHRPDAILLDISLSTEREGFELLPKIRFICPDVPVIVHSGHAEFEAVVEAMRLGASDYIAKGCGAEELVQQLTRAILSASASNPADEATVTGFSAHPEQWIGVSDTAVALRSVIEQVRNFDGNIIISGETGVGKEVVARLLRRNTASGGQEPFLSVDSSTLQKSTAERLLFGYERGAFAGAHQDRPGLFESAHGGTIFFDELSSMPLSVQAKILRVLQEKTVIRLGSLRSQVLNFRVIAATNRKLATMCRRGKFRFDLYSRLDMYTLEISPLRERREDIPILFDYFLKRESSGDAVSIDAKAMKRLEDYEWPGNVRELSNTVRYMLAVARGNSLTQQHLPSKIGNAGLPGGPGFDEVGSLKEQVQSFERRIIQREIRRSGGNIAKAARALQTDRTSLYAKLKECQTQSKGGPKNGFQR